MTRVCLVGADDVDLRAELLASETARDALSSYDLDEPWANCVAVETISIGAAVSLCNDLNWYLRRYADDALVLEPSVSEDEWLSRSLATAVRNERVEAAETGTFLKIYGVTEAGADDDTGAAEDGAPDEPGVGDDAVADETGVGEDGVSDGPGAGELDAGGPNGGAGQGPMVLAEPLFARRVGGETPGYDLRDVEETVVVRVTADEFGA